MKIGNFSRLSRRRIACVPAVLFCLWLLSLLSCVPSAPKVASRGNHQLTQVSVINALMLGRYEGLMPIGELLEHGDFGVGTLDHLDGELILLDGAAYQVRGDGEVVGVDAERSTPFAVVTRFEPDGEFPCPLVTNLTELDSRLDTHLPQKNNFLAIRIEGRFASLKLRSVHRQEPPYRPLADVARSQSVWEYRDIAGTLLAIRCPRSADHEVGGHVLDCAVSGGRLRYEVCRDWLIKLESTAAGNLVNLGEDLSREVRRVESAREDEKPK
jgi:acetolactate decarboxylase